MIRSILFIGSKRKHSNNPWNVTDASVFLKYCCPECDYNHQNLTEFSDHALENHILATVLFHSALNEEQDLENQPLASIKSEYESHFKTEESTDLVADPDFDPEDIKDPDFDPEDVKDPDYETGNIKEEPMDYNGDIGKFSACDFMI